MSEFFSFALPGIPYGCTFALVAVGLVLTFRATGVFNFAFGAEAYAAGVVYAELCQHHVVRWVAAVLVIAVIAPLFGALLDFGLFSRISSTNLTAKIVTSLGVMVFLPEVVGLLLNNATIYGPPLPFLSEGLVGRWGSIAFDGPEFSTALATLVVLVILTFVLRSRRFGLPLRAAVESPRLLELTGVGSIAVIRRSWMISTSLAGLAGILFASQLPTVDPSAFSLVLVAAIAAAALGAMRSISLAVIGGLGMGVVQGVVQGYLPTDSVWYQAFVPSLPFFILLILLVVHPGMRRLERNNDPMAGVEPPAHAPALSLRPPRVAREVRRLRWPFLALVIVGAVDFLSGPWIGALTIGAALSIIFVSITLMTGIAGQLSLAQAAFAGIGACTAAQLADHQGVPILWAALAGALVAGLGGVIAALPALNLRGLPLALLTLCLALLADNLLFPTSWIGNGETGLIVPRPHLFHINMSEPYSRAFFILVLAVMLVATGIVHLLLRGTTGRALSAVHASVIGAESSGVAVRRMTILLFMMSAGLAGLGGAFYAMAYGVENLNDFNWFFGPTFLVIVVAVGVSSVEGAIEAGLGFALVVQVATYLPSRVSGVGTSSATLVILIFSLGAFTYASHPEGIIEYVKRRVTQALFRSNEPVAAMIPTPALHADDVTA